MVCLTSCVFRSIRFSGFARPPHWGAARGRTIHARAGRGQALSRACTGWTQTGEEQLFKAVSAPRESPRRQPRPNGQVPPACRGPHVPCRPRRRIRPPHTQAPRLASQRGRPRDRRGLLMYGDPRSPSPPPSPCEPAGPPCICQELGCGRRAGRTRRRARPLPNARRAMFRPTAAKTATRPIRRASLPAAPRPRGLPPPAQKIPRPEAALGCGPKEQMQVLICLILQRPGGGRRWP